MSKATNPNNVKPATEAAAKVTQKTDGELSETELQEVSGGPTAVEMPVRLTLTTSITNLGQMGTHGAGGGGGAG